MATDLLLHLSDITDDSGMRVRAMSVLEGAAPLFAKFPTGFGHGLGVADMAVHGAVEVAIAGDRGSPDFNLLEREVASHYVPSLVLAGGNPASTDRIALLAGRTPRGGISTAFVCRAYTCEEPVTDATALGRQLDAAGRAAPPAPSEK